MLFEDRIKVYHPTEKTYALVDVIAKVTRYDERTNSCDLELESWSVFDIEGEDDWLTTELVEKAL